MNTILKWAGSKSRLMPELLARLPEGDRLVEPFAGACSVMMNTRYRAYLIADINPDLINLYRQIKENAVSFIATAITLFRQHQTDESYYRLRETFNHDPALSLSERAACFLYLNRHGWRGLCRYNRRGEFNIPFGHVTTPYFPQEEIEAFAQKAQHATFICADFRETLRMVTAGDVVYCDPPYHNTFSGYHVGGFGREEHIALASMLADIAEKNAVVASNSDSDFTRHLYRTFNISRVIAARSLRHGTDKNRPAAEIIATGIPLVPVCRKVSGCSVVAQYR